MTKKLTNNCAIERSKNVFGDKFDYNLFEYKAYKEKVTLICDIHGQVSCAFSDHITSSTGCPRCGRQEVGDINKLGREGFIEKARAKHGNKFDYSGVFYESAHMKVLITCNEHGDFWQTPSSHLQLEHGCPCCAKERTPLIRVASKSTDFIRRVKEKHKEKYLTDKIVYRGIHRKVTLTCREHGDFDILASSLLTGSGCKKCAKNGYRPNVKGILYVLTSGRMTKIGITNNNLKQRVWSISKSSGNKFEVFETFDFEDGSIPLQIESLILKELESSFEKPEGKFDGVTETFLDCDANFVVNRIKKIILTKQAQA